MSKRFKARQRGAQSTAALRNNAAQAFKREDYIGALAIWERLVRQTPDSVPSANLAEAHFRLALQLLSAPTPQFLPACEHLRAAVSYDPKDPRFPYYLGLALQRAGDHPAAVQAYQQAGGLSPEFAQRAAYPLCVALLEQGQDPSTHPAWAMLTPAEQARIQSLTVFRRRPFNVPASAPALLRGMAALDEGDLVAARALFTQAAWGAPPENGAAHYYLGVLAALAEDWETARQEWEQTLAAGWQSGALGQNLGELYHRLAEEHAQAGAFSDAMAVAQEARLHKSDDKALDELLDHLKQHQAYAAAQNVDWQQAQQLWQEANALSGGSFRLAYNLALVYEQTDDFIAAAEMWREALRRRPRRDDHPDAINDAQVARLWRRAAEAYVKGGEYEEAIHVYKMAVKWAPDNLETRMMLADGLMADGRLEAAQNELLRILELDPKHISALLKMAEIQNELTYWYSFSQAHIYLERVLEIDPDHDIARQSLVEHYIETGLQLVQWGNVDKALQNFQKALEYAPDNPVAVALMGGCYIKLKRSKDAHASFARALDSPAVNFEACQYVLTILLHEGWVQEIPAYAERIASLRDIEEPLVALFLSQAVECMPRNHPRLVEFYTQLAETVAPPDYPLYLQLSDMLVMGPSWQEAAPYIQKALERQEAPAKIQLLLAIFSMRQGQHPQAVKYLKEAKRLARRAGDRLLLEGLEAFEPMLDAPPYVFDSLFMSGMSIGVDALLEMLRIMASTPPPPFGFHEEYDDDFFGF